MSNRYSQFARGVMSLHTRMLFASFVAFLCLIGLSRPCLAQPSEVSYQGELKKDGLPFTGTAQMKFVLVDGAGESIWSNDGTSTSGSEPAVPVDVSATNGIFAIRLGAIPMEPISGGLLKGVTEVALRVWVNTGDGFEQLTDQPISSSAFSLSGEKCLEIGDLQINVVPRWDGSALTPGSLFDDGTNVGVGTNAPSTKLDVAGTVRSSTGGFQFPDGTLQTTAVTGGGGGVPSGAMIVTNSPSPPAGYAYSGVSVTQVGTDRWRSAAPIPDGPYDIAAAALNGQIYTFGGRDPADVVLSSVYRFDPSTNIWTQQSSMPIQRLAACAVSFDERIFLIGGRASISNSVASKTIYEFDPVQDSWIQRANMLEGRHSHRAVVANGKIFVFGGQNEHASLLNAVEAYDPETDSWESKAYNPFLESSVGAVLEKNGLIYLFAYDSFGHSIYDPATDSWAESPGLTSSVSAGFVLDDKFILFFGTNANEYDWVNGILTPVASSSMSSTARWAIPLNGEVYTLDYNSRLMMGVYTPAKYSYLHQRQ